MQKTRGYLQDQKNFVKVAIVLLVVVSIGVALLVYAAGFNFSGAELWLNKPISELKIWHLILIAFITSLLAGR